MSVVYNSYICVLCGHIYHEEEGCPEDGIAPGTLWEDVPMNWTCPECSARKEDFELID
jgi:rubredoxin